jgi:hypothetical protein
MKWMDDGVGEQLHAFLASTLYAGEQVSLTLRLINPWGKSLVNSRPGYCGSKEGFLLLRGIEPVV